MKRRTAVFVWLPFATALAVIACAHGAEAQRVPGGATAFVPPLDEGGLRLLSTGGYTGGGATAGLATSLAVPWRSALIVVDGSVTTSPVGSLAGGSALGLSVPLGPGALLVRAGVEANVDELDGKPAGVAGARLERDGFSVSLSTTVFPGTGPIYRDTVLSPGDSTSHRILVSEATPRRMLADAEAAYRLATGRFELGAVIGRRIAGRAGAWWARAAIAYTVAPTVAIGATAGRDVGSPWRAGESRPFVSLFLRFDSPFRDRSVTDHTPRGTTGAMHINVDYGSVTFTIVDANARSVEVAGDFTDWQPLPLQQIGASRWTETVALSRGVYHVSVRVDGGPWQAPPGLPAVPDELGGETGVFEVR